MNADKQCLLSELMANTPLNDAVFRLDFSWTGPAPRAGQFFLIRPLRSSVLLGRPISVFRWVGNNADGNITGGIVADGNDEGKSGCVSFLILLRGRGTRELASLRAGEGAELSGPLGNCWGDFLTGPSGGVPVPAALMGGGIGIAPLAAFAAELAPETYDFYAGFRSASFGLGDLKPRSLVTAIEDGGGGLRGRIPDFLDPAKYRAVYACGPEPMLRAVAAVCGKAGVPCFISLERRMACGTGACLGCTVKTLGGNRRCCTDGPVFPAGELDFG